MTTSATVRETVFWVGCAAIDVAIVCTSSINSLSMITSGFLATQVSIAGLRLGAIQNVVTRRFVLLPVVFALWGLIGFEEGVPVHGYAGESLLAIAMKAGTLVLFQFGLSYVATKYILSRWRTSDRIVVRYSLRLLLSVVAATAVSAAFLTSLPRGGLALDFGRELLGVSVYAISNGLAASMVLIWLSTQKGLAIIKSLPWALVGFGVALAVEWMLLMFLWMDAQMGSTLVLIVVMQTMTQTFYCLLAVAFLRLYRD